MCIGEGSCEPLIRKIYSGKEILEFLEWDIKKGSTLLAPLFYSIQLFIAITTFQTIDHSSPVEVYLLPQAYSHRYMDRHT